MRKIEDFYNIFINSAGICTDSRNIIYNSIFFALKGASFDGNLFAQTALDKGCICAVVDNLPQIKDDRYIYVEDVLSFLQALALYHRKNVQIPVIGITGTNGKTSTKELLTEVLSQKYNVLATKGNLNNHIGVPLTILSIRNEHELAVIEMGANHPGEIAELCAIAKPTHGIITNVGKAHLEGFVDIETIARTKGALYESLVKDNGVAFVNKRDARLCDMSKNLERIFYSNEADSTVSVVVKDETPFLVFDLVIKECAVSVQSNLYGSYNSNNFAAAACAAYAFGVGILEVKKAFEAYVPANNRSQFLKTATNHIFLDAYNANPTSMSLALRAFKNQEYAKKVVIIGDMKELGKSSEDEHRKIIGELENYKFDHVFLVGEEFFKLATDRFHFFKDTSMLKSFLTSFHIKNAGILIKASRSIGLENIVASLNK